MFRLVEFFPDDIKLFKNYGGQEELVSAMSMDDLAILKEKGAAYSFFWGDEILGCAGLLQQTKYRALAWAVFQKTHPRTFIKVHSASLWIANSHGYKKLEAYVRPEFKAAMRWIKLLGFSCEQDNITYFFPDGGSASYWAYYPPE